MSNSRLEKFIYAICSMEVSDLPAPLSRIEILWNCLITGETPDFEPQSRNEQYLMAMLGLYELDQLPTPMSRGEKLLYKIAMGETDLSDIPAYLSRYEELLGYLAENGGVGDFKYILQTLNQRLSTLYSTKEQPMKQAVIKGDTLVNELPRPSLKNTMTNVASQKLNHGYDNGKTLVNLLQNNKIMYQGTDEISDAYLETSCIYFPKNKGYVFNYTIKANKDYYVNFKDTVNISNIRLYRVSGSYSHSDNILELTSSQKINVSEDCYLRVWSNGNGSVQELMMFEHQDGMENWDIPYFEGTKTFSATPNVVDGEFKQAVVKGQTLVNIIDGKKSVDYATHIKEFYTPSVKVNTKYLIIYDTNSNNSSVTSLSIGFLKNTQTPAWSNSNENAPLKGKIILDSGSEPYCCRINGKIGGSALTVNSIMVIEYQEGMENCDIPYFEGMQSVQLSEVTTTGKNLFDGKLKHGEIAGGVDNTDTKYVKSVNYISIEPNTYYSLTCSDGYNSTSGRVICWYDSDKNYISHVNHYGVSPSNAYFARLRTRKDDSTAIPTAELSTIQAQLEKGKVATSYEPYRSNTLTLAEPVTLRKIGETEDEFDALTGQVTERVGEVVLDGIFTYWMSDNKDGTKRFGRRIGNMKANSTLICDNLPIIDFQTDVGAYGIAVYNKDIVLYTQHTSIDELRTYLQQNLITIQYQLETESTKTVNATITDQDGATQTKLHSFNDGHLSVSSQGLLPSAVNYEVPTNNSYYLPDMLTLGAQYTSRGSADCHATIDGKLLALGKNRTFTTPSSVTDKLMVLDAPVDDLMFIKGDQTAKDFGYFEGMKSVGLSNKMPVLMTTGKNLLKTKTATFNFEGNKQVSELVGYVKVEKNKQYTVSFSFQKNIDANSGGGVEIVGCNDIPEESLKYWYASNDSRCKLFNKNSSITEKSTINNFKYTIPSDHDVNYIAIYCGSYFKEYVGIVENVQIETGTTATSYEPHKSNILNTSKDVVLRGIGNVKDELDCLTGEVTERIGEIVLDGSENWRNTTTGAVRFSISLENLTTDNNRSPIISDYFPYASSGHKYPSSFVYGGLLYVYLEKTTTLEELKTWLGINKPSVQYQLATDSIKTVDLITVDQDGQPTQLKTFNDITHVELSSEGLIPEVELEVATKINETLLTMSPQHHDISETQNKLGQTIDEQTENTDAAMLATTEIYEQTL